MRSKIVFYIMMFSTIHSFAVPLKTAYPSEWLAWFKSLQVPTKTNLLKANAYVNSKWRCLRYGENCSYTERVALGTLATIVTAMLVQRGITLFKGHMRKKKEFPLQYAARHWQINEVKRLLNQGADPNVALGSTGSVTILKELLNAGADPNRADAQGWTALMYSATAIDRENIAAELLKNKDLDINVYNQGAKALKNALLYNHIAIAEMLLSREDIKGKIKLDILNDALENNYISQEKYNALRGYAYEAGKERYEIFSHGLVSPESPVKLLPREVKGKIFEYVTELPLSRKQQTKLMEKSNKKVE